MMMMIMNCFCGMFDWRKGFGLFSSWDHCQRSSPLKISDTPKLKLCMTELAFLEHFFCSKNWGNRPKIKFFWLNLKKNLVISFPWIFSKMKIYTISNVMLRKILFLRYRPKCFQPMRFLNQPFLRNILIKQPHFLHAATNSWKLKLDWKFLGWAWSKTGVANPVSRP